MASKVSKEILKCLDITLVVRLYGPECASTDVARLGSITLDLQIPGMQT
jgi:hypothetical protein